MKRILDFSGGRSCEPISNGIIGVVELLESRATDIHNLNSLSLDFQCFYVPRFEKRKHQNLGHEKTKKYEKHDTERRPLANVWEFPLS